MNIIMILSLLLVSIVVVLGLIIVHLYGAKLSEERQYSALSRQLLQAIKRFERSFQKFNEASASIPHAPTV